MAELVVERMGDLDVAGSLALLRQLSEEVGERFLSDEATLLAQAKKGFCEFGVAKSEGIVGVVVFFPYFSTSRGRAGTFVIDLVIAPNHRGQNIGPNLLGYAARVGAEKWQSDFIVLGVHEKNTDAERFYQRLGFENSGQRLFVLEADETNAMRARYES